ncbi:adenine-specific DNA-methyltransferase [Nitrosomonas nitrosa]|uniref:site-specific DNA-methyltransferase (adenine-specific) n=1 Tax=Nitrosomonas nitrosa TaxID=52442 RepID=A0A1I4MUY0_9PROT|nr:site-specific DNA-methyltransferase [Nitrosomonas nitrosa]SFM07018.1 adenine-specific DNA-methyltransferase [Nitrosomonas nitrosa]
MKLSDNEIRDITLCLEAGKPLPDKYRFLLFEDKREVELVWNGKTNEVCNIVLPFQTIEQVDEPRAEKSSDTALQPSLFDIDNRGRQLKGWTNKLIWGDNKLILSSLKNGPLREEIEKQGGLKLIYIDPPFDVGADFSMDIEIGGDTFTKKPNILEEIAYRDTWGKGADSFIAMIYERLVLMRDLLAEDGSIYVHCDWRVNSYIRLVMDEVFGKEKLLNQIIWKRIFSHSGGKKFGIVDDTILLYIKSDSFIFNKQTKPHSDSYIKSHYGNVDEDGRRYRLVTLSAKGSGPARQFGERTIAPPKGRHWAWTQERINEGLASGKIVFASTGQPNIKQYLDDTEGTVIQTIWDDLPGVNPVSSELVSYPTQKSEALLERIIKASSNEDDLVADFFCGSGTTAAVAEKLGRKWIASDLGKFALHTTRKRMIGVQRQLKAEGKDYRAFEILNLGKYERQHYIGVNPDLREEQKQQQLAAKEAAFLDLILRAYRAEKVTQFACFHGKKAGRLVAVGPVNLPVTRLFVEEVILECRKQHITKVDILGFEFEMGLFPNVLDEARAKGIDIAPKYIPAEVFDKRAVEKNQVVFHDVSFIEVKPHIKGNTLAVELTDFSVFYAQDSIAYAEATLKDKQSKIVVEKGQIVKVSRDKDGVITREQLTRHWTDWIDYWSVDFDFENKREIIRVRKFPPGQGALEGMEPPQMTLDEYEEVWTGDYVFENEWQSFRTKKDRSLELISVFHEVMPGRRKIAVKVVDIFGNDTMTIVEVRV